MVDLILMDSSDYVSSNIKINAMKDYLKNLFVIFVFCG